MDTRGKKISKDSYQIWFEDKASEKFKQATETQFNFIRV